MKGQRRVRGCGQDSVWLTIAPDPLDQRPTPMLHVAVNTGSASEVAMLTLAGARRLHAALGALLEEAGHG